MFKVNNKDTRATLWIYFTPCSSVTIANFEHVIAGWVSDLIKSFRRTSCYHNKTFNGLFQEQTHQFDIYEASIGKS